MDDADHSPDIPEAPPPAPSDGAYVFHAVGKALMWDYARGGFALFVVVGVLGVMTPWSIAWAIMAALLMAIVGYLFNTVYRHGLRIEMTEEGLMSGWRNPLDPTGPVLLAKKELPWAGLRDFHMRHFSRKQKETEEGWIMLRLKGTGTSGRPVTITFDGAHEGFTPVLARAWGHARRRGLLLDEATLANMEALGFSTTEPAPWTS